MGVLSTSNVDTLRNTYGLPIPLIVQTHSLLDGVFLLVEQMDSLVQYWYLFHHSTIWQHLYL